MPMDTVGRDVGRKIRGGHLRKRHGLGLGKPLLGPEGWDEHAQKSRDAKAPWWEEMWVEGRPM